MQVLNGNPYNRKCDVYSFGICLWEIYCCDMPYPDLSFSEVTSAVVRQVTIYTYVYFFLEIRVYICKIQDSTKHKKTQKQSFILLAL